MSTPKNKLTADFERREKKTSVVQRFIAETEAEVPQAAETTKTEPETKYYLRNVMEEAVVAEVTSSMKHMSGMCKCEKCFYDICAITLNSMSPNYATSEQGELLGKANALLNVEVRNKISNAVFNAIEKVKKSPMHVNPVYDNSAPSTPAPSKSIGKIVSK